MEFCYTAIVLRKKEIGETDRLYTLYTRESGKVQAVARGVRKAKAKLAGHLETLNRGSVVVMRSRGTGTITSAVADHYRISLKNNSVALSIVLGAVRMFERLVDVNERDEALFMILEDFLDTADRLVGAELADRTELLAQAFLFQTLGRLGYRIEAQRSVMTGVTLVAGGRYCFRFDEGGVAEYESGLSNAVLISENAIKLLRLFLGHSVRSLAKVQADGVVLAETRRILEGMLKWIG